MHARLKREEALVTAHVQQENDQQDDSDSVVEDDDAITKSKCCEARVQTCIVNLEEECCNLRSEKQQLSESIMKTAFTQESMSPEAKVQFYTGLPSFFTLMAVFNFVAPFVPHTAPSVLPQFQQFMMTLMKLRLNLLDQDMAYRFEVSHSTVSKTWRKWVDAMFIRLKPLIKWPT